MPYIDKSAWHLVIHLVRTGDIDLVVHMLAGEINFTTTLDLFLPASGDRLFCVVMMEWRNGPSWLRDDDNDKDDDGDVDDGSDDVTVMMDDDDACFVMYSQWNKSI